MTAFLSFVGFGCDGIIGHDFIKGGQSCALKRRNNMIVAHRFHEFSYGHRVVGQGGKCEHLHGHNGVVTFYCVADELDNVGRVIDFSFIKSTLCAWLEDNFDHRFLVWEKDVLKDALAVVDDKIVVVPFNPTAENIASYLLNEVGPKVLPKGVRLVQVDFQETTKCGATVSLPSYFGSPFKGFVNEQ